MNGNDDNSRFTIRDRQESPDSIFMADAENLRIEKLNTRVTLVAVLIPCLLVIVLAVAYLDIKNRVINTQNTGSMGVQNLSKDLESRFSNLSLKQARLDQQLEAYSKSLETATVALQVNLKKATTEFERITEGKPDQSALTALSNKMDTSLTGLQKDLAGLEKDIADLNAAFSKFDEELAAQILLMAEGLKKDQGRLAEIEKKTQRLDQEKLSKDSMDLALRLERLSLQEMVKDRIREVEKKLTGLSQQLETLIQRLDAQVRRVTPPSPAAVAPPPSPSPESPSRSATIVEQTIN